MTSYCVEKEFSIVKYWKGIYLQFMHIKLCMGKHTDMYVEIAQQ